MGRHGVGRGGHTAGQRLGRHTPLALEVLAVVERIPPGKVMSYGDVAELVGRGAPRGVGMVMAQHGHEVCWWRVVQASGAPTRSGPAEALRHLLAEGTALRTLADGERRVDMGAARWDGRSASTSRPTRPAS